MKRCLTSSLLWGKCTLKNAEVNARKNGKDLQARQYPELLQWGTRYSVHRWGLQWGKCIRITKVSNFRHSNQLQEICYKNTWNT